MNIEPLESRIAPAGVVALSIVGTTLKIVGDDAANVFTVTQLADGSVRFDALSGTQLRVGDNLQTDVQFTSAEGRSMSFELFAGSDEVIIAGLSLYKDLKVNAGSGDDELTLENVTLSGKLEIKGGAGVNTVNLDGALEIGGTFSYLGGDGADSILGDLSSFRAAGALMDLKDGRNTVSISEANALWQLIESFRVIAGSGDDSVEISGNSLALGSLDVNLGGGTNGFEAEFTDILVSSVVKLNSGTGADVFEVTAANSLTLRKGLTANLGDGPGDFQLATGGNLSVRGATTVNFGDALDGQTDANSARIGGKNVNLGPLGFSWGASNPGSFVLAGYDVATGVTADNPARNITLGSLKVQGASSTIMNATDTITVRGSANIYSNNPGSGLLGVVSLTATSIDITGNLVSSISGDTQFTLAADRIEVGSRLGLAWASCAGGTCESIIGVPGGTTTVGAFSSRTSVGREGSIECLFYGRIESADAFAIVDKDEAINIQFFNVDLDIGKSFTLDLGAGDSTVVMEGRLFRADSVSFKSAADALEVEQILFGYTSVEWTYLKVDAGAGASAFSLDAESGRIGTALINLGAGANSVDIHSNAGLRIGKLGVVSASAAGAANESLSLEGVIAREAGAVFGGADSILAIARCTFGKFATALGAGADTVRINDSSFGGELKILTEAGDDTVLIERDTAFAGASVFRGKVTVALGSGDDAMLAAGAADEQKANFRAAVSVDAGPGTDNVLAHPVNATFTVPALVANVP